MTRKPLFFVLFVALAAIQVQADTVVEEIVARVNDRIITRSELERSRQQLDREIQQAQNLSPAEAEERRKNLLRDLIDQQLLLDRGADLGITADTEMIKQLDQMRKQMNLESMEELQKAAEAQGVNFEDYKQSVRENIITQMVISREVGARVHIGREELRSYYEKHKDELKQEERVRLEEILVAPKVENEGAEASPAALQDAKKKADEILAAIRGGLNFETIAKEHSDGPTAADGGDLGYFKRGMLAKQLEDLTFSMKKGEVSEVIRTKQGYVILKVTDHQEAGVPPLKDVEDQLSNAIYLERLQPELRKYLTELREQSYINIKDGYVDAGASPNQTNLVYTVASKDEPEQEQKKKKKRFIFF